MLPEALTGCGLCADHYEFKLRVAEETVAAPDKMNEPNSKPGDPKLGSLLREARIDPPLPSRFQQDVWRRIESAEARGFIAGDRTWLDALVGWVLRPRLAFALTAVLVLTGVGLGWSRGEQLARHEAQARYLTAVAPNSLR